MYTKEELQKMDIPQLMEIANSLGVKVAQDDSLEKVIYDILDKAAIDSANNTTGEPKKKRTRIAKKDTDKVYAVKGKEGENFDLKNSKSMDIEAPSLFADEQIIEEEKQSEEKPAPKKRGRKPKIAKEETHDNSEEISHVEELPVEAVAAEGAELVAVY